MTVSYGVAAEFRRQTGIGTDSRFDTIVDEYLGKASEYMDIELKVWASTPLSSPPAAIHDIANDIAVGMYREDRLGSSGQPVQTDAASKRGRDALKAYITSTYAGGGAGMGTRRYNLFRKVDYSTGDEDGGVNL